MSLRWAPYRNNSVMLMDGAYVTKFRIDIDYHWGHAEYLLFHETRGLQAVSTSLADAKRIAEVQYELDKAT